MNPLVNNLNSKYYHYSLMNYIYSHSFHYSNIIHILNILKSSDRLSSNNDMRKLMNLLCINVLVERNTQNLKDYDLLINFILEIVKKYDINISYPIFPCKS